jgi:hypothetical protein
LSRTPRQTAAVAGALADGGYFDLFVTGLQVGQAQFEWGRGALTADLEAPTLGVYLLGDHREMVANKKSIVGGDRILKVRHRGFVIGRPV